MKTETKPGRPSDDVWSAPESGTVRDPTSGNQPAQGQDSDNSNPQTHKKSGTNGNESKASATASKRSS